jgi:hypothetical protein
MFIYYQIAYLLFYYQGIQGSEKVPVLLSLSYKKESDVISLWSRLLTFKEVLGSNIGQDENFLTKLLRSRIFRMRLMQKRFFSSWVLA